MQTITTIGLDITKSVARGERYKEPVAIAV